MLWVGTLQCMEREIPPGHSMAALCCLYYRNIFWLRISRILTPALKSSRLIRYAGQNTWTVMMHHSISFFLMNFGLALLAVWGFLDGFDWTGFREEMWYTYIPGDEHFVFFYLLIGMVFPLTIKYLYEKMILYLNRKINWTKIKIWSLKMRCSILFKKKPKEK